MVFTWKRTVCFAILHFLTVQLLEGFVFLIAHLPPSITFLDFVIVCCNWLQRILLIPKGVLRSLVPVPENNRWLNSGLALVTSLLWGIIAGRFYPKKVKTSLLE
ncbi:MAG: hypothetical protein JWM04_2028 [Verrucomicrobiales bacterium]|nr:hypothetical protein [Verrucomicrobiales bacterium]